MAALGIKNIMATGIQIISAGNTVKKIRYNSGYIKNKSKRR